MRYLLDTNTCIYIIKRKPKDVLEKFQTIIFADIGISSITVAELEYGAAKSQYPDRNRAALTQFLIPLEIVRFDEQEASFYGNLRATLERAGQTIGAMDLLIAAHALSLDLTLVTNNTKEFNRVQALAIENWVAQ
jgi:tRNA(fMet)-specific endonuclease VapC